jgi:hypothetical protein
MKHASLVSDQIFQPSHHPNELQQNLSGMGGKDIICIEVIEPT